MTAKIINLGNARKQKKRAEKEINAAANRTKFGRTGAQKKDDKITDQKAVKHLDGHKLDPDNAGKNNND